MNMTKIDRKIWQRLPTRLHIATRYAEELEADSIRYANSMRELASNYTACFNKFCAITQNFYGF